MQICCAGEVMVEMAAVDGTTMHETIRNKGSLYRRGVAGDSYNTAVYLARAGLAVDYLTRLGDDPDSDEIIAALTREGIGTDMIERCPGRQPGLYIIDNDALGERQFRYWRERAPARELFLQPRSLDAVDVFYFTGITLAITRAGLANLLDLLRELRERKCRIVFDPNYRAVLWENEQQARQHYQAVLPLCDVVLPTLDDDKLLWGIETVPQCQAMYADYGISELVIKASQLTAHAFVAGECIVRQAAPVTALDTTGAGDAFNAGYLAVRLRGGDLASAIIAAQQLAAAVVQHRGAILPISYTNFSHARN